MQDLINQLKEEFHSKPSPGPILNQIAEDKLADLAARYPDHDKEALWIGAYLADMYITEAIKTGDITKHVQMALDRAQEIIKSHNIPQDKAEIILEIIGTHHGGKQKHIESKLFTNADCFKFLLPKGVFHIFSAVYKDRNKEVKDPHKRFLLAIQYAMFKVDEKFALVNLDDELVGEAKKLYNHWQFIFAQTGVSKNTPDLYSK